MNDFKHGVKVAMEEVTDKYNKNKCYDELHDIIEKMSDNYVDAFNFGY